MDILGSTTFSSVVEQAEGSQNSLRRARAMYSNGGRGVFMRNLSETEQALRERRRAGFDAFFQESRPVLVDFMKRLGFEEPHAVLLDARKFLGPLDAWMRAQVVGTDQRTWILTRLGYFI